MSNGNFFPDVSEIHSEHPAQGGPGSDRLSAAPDPVMLDKIGKGLHELYDGVPRSTLPIYFGPVLGELYLTPLSRRRSA
jgi:hypothetical protein